MDLILGSSSTYRKSLLERLTVDFKCYSPDIDEAPKPGEHPQDMVERLAITKAKKVAAQFPHSLIIGSDQTAVLNGAVIGKPMTEEKAIEQLTACSGRTVTFLTSLCLLNAENGNFQCRVIPFHVSFRELTAEQIRGYIKKEQPLNCAGSFKVEGLGITLFEKLEGEDPTSLIGLPLIALTEMLRNEGIEPLS